MSSECHLSCKYLDRVLLIEADKVIVTTLLELEDLSCDPCIMESTS
jgi:hypothetical protein